MKYGDHCGRIAVHTPQINRVPGVGCNGFILLEVGFGAWTVKPETIPATQRSEAICSQQCLSESIQKALRYQYRSVVFNNILSLALSLYVSFQALSQACEKRLLTLSYVFPSVQRPICPPAGNNSYPTGRIFMKFDFSIFRKSVKKIQFH